MEIFEVGNIQKDYQNLINVPTTIGTTYAQLIVTNSGSKTNAIESIYECYGSQVNIHVVAHNIIAIDNCFMINC